VRKSNLDRQIAEIRADIDKVRRHHYDEVKTVYDSQLKELSGIKDNFRTQVKSLQTET
jgi:hypothetical protein